VTGSHEASLDAVAQGRADIAAIDCVSFALIGRAKPKLAARVAVVCETAASPCLPFIASALLPAATIAATREALMSALGDPTLRQARETLGLIGASATAPADYERIVEIERAAERAGYPRLA